MERDKGPLVAEERDALQEILKHPILQKAAAHVLSEVKGKESLWLSCNLSSQEGVARAMQLQYEAKGILRAFQGLVDLAQDPLEEEQESGTEA